MSDLPLTGGGLDRAAHRRRDRAWLDDAWARARVLVVAGGTVAVRGTPEKAQLVFVGPEHAPAGADRYFLGVDADGQPYFAVPAPQPPAGSHPAPGSYPASGSHPAAGEGRAAAAGADDGGWTAGLREIGTALGERDATLLTTAVALANWHARHGFSPVDGSATEAGEAGWIRTSAAGQLWPRTDPAVIVLVHDGDPGPTGSCLLASNVAWPPVDGHRRYSCVAGFVEPGESAERAVAREVGEELGVAVREVSYIASQPWPFPASLMLGFTAVTEPGAELRLGADEIADARWFTRQEIGGALRGTVTGFGLPLDLSVARYLIAGWAAGGIPPR